MTVSRSNDDIGAPPGRDALFLPKLLTHRREQPQPVDAGGVGGGIELLDDPGNVLDADLAVGGRKRRLRRRR